MNLYLLFVFPVSREKIERKLAEINKRLRLYGKQLEKSESKIIQLQEKYESRKKQNEQEWQAKRKDLQEQQDQSRHHADLLQSNQREQLSEDLGLPEEPPKEFLEAHVADEKRKVAEIELRASEARHEQLREYQVQASDLVGRLENFVDQLNNHIVALKERKKALEKLKGCGKNCIKEMTECDQQLEQLQQELEKAQEKLKRSKENLRQYKDQLEECVYEMSKCEGTLSLSLIELRRCLDRLDELREKLTRNSSNLEGRIWFGSYFRGVKLFQMFIRMLGYSSDQLEGKEDELCKCRKELEATKRTLEGWTETVQKFEVDLRMLKERVTKNVNMAASCSQVRLIYPAESAVCMW